MTDSIHSDAGHGLPNYSALPGRKRLPNSGRAREETVFGAELEGCRATLTWSQPYAILYALGCAREDVLYRVPEVPEAIVDEALTQAAGVQGTGSGNHFRLIARRLVRLCWGTGVDRRLVDALDIELRVYAAIAVALTTPAPVQLGRRHGDSEESSGHAQHRIHPTEKSSVASADHLLEQAAGSAYRSV